MNSFAQQLRRPRPQAPATPSAPPPAPDAVTRSPGTTPSPPRPAAEQYAPQRVPRPVPPQSPAGALAETTDGVTSFSPAAVGHAQAAEIAAHEAVHRSQFAMSGRLEAGSHDELERDAQRGSGALLAGGTYAPRVAASPGQTLTFDPFMPDPDITVPVNWASLSTLGQTTPSGEINLATAQEVDTEGRRRISYRLEVRGAGRRGSVDTTTELSVTYDPGTPFGTAGGLPLVRTSELGLGPAVPVPVYPVVIRYHRQLHLTDSYGRDVEVSVFQNVFFTHESWADAIAGRPATYETLVDLRGDEADISVTINGTGPIQPYYTDYFGAAASSISRMANAAATNLRYGTWPFFLTSTVDANFVKSELTAGEQFNSLEEFLIAADIMELARQIELERKRLEAMSWFDRWWDDLPDWARGVLLALRDVGIAIAVVASIALLVVAAAKGAVAFGAAMLIVGGIALVGGLAWSLVSRFVEAERAGVTNTEWILTVAILDATGASAIIEAITNQSILTGLPLPPRSLEERWHAGTAGAIQLILLIAGAVFGARGRAAPPTPLGESPPLVTPELPGGVPPLVELPLERPTLPPSERPTLPPSERPTLPPPRPGRVPAPEEPTRPTSPTPAPRLTTRFGLPEDGYVPSRIFMDWLPNPIPAEGWKLHVSASEASAAEIADLVLPALRDMGVNHKVVGTLERFLAMSRGQQGKFITVYPDDANHAQAIVSMLDGLLSGRRLGGPAVSGEQPVGTSGLVYTRYGGFTKSTVTAPDGQEVPDIRGQICPPWIENPWEAR